MPVKTVIIVTGPTASGKTDLAILLAQIFQTSIISADARQCFRELNIGVAKPGDEQLCQVEHFFINSHSIFEEVNASLFETLALNWCDKIFNRSDTVIMCGGTGLYIKAFRDGLDEIPKVSEIIRKDVQTQYQNQGMDWLVESVRVSDPVFYSTGEIANPQRMMRALEVILSTGHSILSFRNHHKKKRPFRILEFGLKLPREDLYQRINQRVDEMMNRGLLNEVEALQEFQHLNALQTVGYSELFSYLQNKIKLDEAVPLIKQNTRRYAKRQMTWLNKNQNMIWLEKDPLKQVLSIYNSAKI